MTTFNIELKSLKAHDTLKISLEDSSHTFDLYYYCLDNTFLDKEQDIAKGLLNFIAMIENWKLKINKLKIGESDFLPFDYSDQYIGFFIVLRTNTESISIQSAFTTEYQGWELNPSQLYLENLTHKPYNLDEKQYIISINKFSKGIEDSITNMLSSFYTKTALKT